ncbi:hypothetical protein K227x_05340 [Rubripirellula lacrimiformis]|uniref:Uncharacterized protein n=1 Tax=Rubripirellula lacrimiformis TaxID=1930273 RepID=A0A517N4V4_9BACT|nr:hypothetical protein [Rubripirellula lacrimiformis]QDT02163.1 hypothetical protein K227x_05340 [Rubripirellula lacrimiformis]
MATRIDQRSTAVNETNEPDLGEPDAHVISRHLRTGTRALLIAFIAATILLFLFYRQAAYLAAIPVPILAAGLIIVNELERRSRASALREAHQTQISQSEIEADVETAGIAMALKILGVLMLGTFVIAAAFFDSAVLGIGAAVALLLVLLIELPFLPLMISESQRDEREKLTGKRD